MAANRLVGIGMVRKRRITHWLWPQRFSHKSSAQQVAIDPRQRFIDEQMRHIQFVVAKLLHGHHLFRAGIGGSKLSCRCGGLVLLTQCPIRAERVAFSMPQKLHCCRNDYRKEW